MSHRLFVMAALSLTSFAWLDRATAIEPDYPCYMRTTSGRLMNLGALCAGVRGAGAIESLQLDPRPSVSSSSFSTAPTRWLKVREGREAQEKTGQYFNYEVLTDQTNNRFRLRYWTEDSAAYRDSQEFRTAQGAVDYFECVVIGRDTTACPASVARPTSGFTPRSTYTGTVYGPGSSR